MHDATHVFGVIYLGDVACLCIAYISVGPRGLSHEVVSSDLNLKIFGYVPVVSDLLIVITTRKIIIDIINTGSVKLSGKPVGAPHRLVL